METPKITVQRVGCHDRRRILRLSGAVNVVLEYDALFSRVYCNGERVTPVICLHRGFERSVREFTLRELGPEYRFRLEVEAILGTILTFRLLLNRELLFEDRDQGQNITFGTQCPLGDTPIPAASTQKEPNLPYPVERRVDES